MGVIEDMQDVGRCSWFVSGEVLCGKESVTWYDARLFTAYQCVVGRCEFHPWNVRRFAPAPPPVSYDEAIVLQVMGS